MNESSHGYKLKANHLSKLRMEFGINDGQLYPTLKKLENEGLIKKEVNLWFDLIDQLAADLYMVPFDICLHPGSGDNTIDPYLALKDHLVGLSARRKTAPGDYFLNSFFHD